MLLIECPYCGPRDESEFSYGGEANIARPTNSAELSDAEWADYLFMRSNPKGAYLEQWCHSHGCRRWLVAERDTVSYRIKATYRLQDAPKEVSGDPA